MLTLIVAGLSACTDPEAGIKKTCNNHGKCENDVCVCEAGYDSVAGPLCNVCAEGFELSTEGINRCVHIETCMTGTNNDRVPECYGHGFCTAEDSYDPATKWFCKCVNHFANQTGTVKKQLTNCSVCMNRYTLNEAGTKCLASECNSSPGLAFATECNAKGFCLDTTTGNPIIDLAIDQIEKIIEDLIGITIPDPGCICKPHMDALCTQCDEGYRQYEEETQRSQKCVFDACSTEVGECNNQGTCAYDAFDNQYECTCNKNYSPKARCQECIYHFTLESGCTACAPGYDVATECYQCLFGRDEATNCMTCLPGFDIDQDCKACLGGHDPLTRCQKCPAGMVENGSGKCVNANTSSSTAMIVTFSVIGALAVAIAAVVLTVYFMRKKRAAAVDLDEQETFAQ